MSLDDAQNLDDENYHAYMLQIRRADGTVVVSVTASLDFGRPWSLIPMRPDGKRHIADQGNVWVYTPDREISRDEDGTYFISID